MMEKRLGRPNTASARTEHELEELFLLRLRYKEGQLEEAEGNRALLLDDPETVWVVYTGKVDVFAVEIEEGRPSSSRTHLMRMEPGQALFGLPLADAADFPGSSAGPPLRARPALLAVGTQGTKLLRLNRSRLTALAHMPSQAPGIVDLVDSWVSRLSRAVAQTLPPKDCVNLETSGSYTLPAASSFRPARGVLWVRHKSGRYRFAGPGGDAVVEGEGYFPLTRHTWLQGNGEEELHLDCIDTSALLRQHDPWPHLDRFHQTALRWAAASRQRALAEERARLLHREEVDEGRMRRSLQRLSSIMENNGTVPFAPEEETDPWLAACRLIGEVLGTTIRAPQREERGRSDPLLAIARASRLRVREVRLTENWWQRDGGPLLARRKTDGQPVALLPSSPRRYILHDPVAGTRTPVDGEVAAALAPSAYTFYRPLPSHPLTFQDLWRFGLQWGRRDMAMAALMSFGAGLLGLLVPFATGILFDAIVPAGDRSLLLQVALGLGASAFAIAAFQFAGGIAALRAEGRMGASLQAALWDRLISLPAGFFRGYNAGDLAMRALSLDYARQLAGGIGITTVFSAAFSFLGFGVLLYYDPLLAAATALLALLALGVLAVGSIQRLRVQREVAARQGRISGILFQLLTGVAKVRATGAEKRAFGVWAREFAEQKRLYFRSRAVQNRLAAFGTALPFLSSLTLLAVIATRGVDTMPAPRFLAFHAAFAQVLAGIHGLNLAASSLLAVVPLLERVRPILHATPEVTADRKDPGELTGDIEVAQVSFRYHPDGPLVLDSVSLRARPGEFVAIVGPSGSGKSTLLRLLLGFETPESGAIYYDGQDLAGLDVQGVRRQVGVVLQHAQLMPGDIYSNIVGSRPLTLADAWEAARMAGLEDDIRQMPMGMHTMVSEGGTTFSGGQRQRLLIARALAAKPRIFFLDEATSALDNEAQEHVIRSLERLQATRIVVAHRLSTIVNADRIYVLQGGRVVESGTYDELMKQKGLFATLARRQLA